MQTKTVFIIILIGVLFNISDCNGATGSCTCCAGNSCRPTLQGTITVSSCSSSSCKSVCQAEYPRQCTDGAGSANYQCTGGTISTANWAGVFNMANRCDLTICCCPIGQMIASRVSANALHIQGRFAGEGCDGFSSLDQTIPMPNGYNTQIGFIGNIILVTLSEDSRTIEFNNPNYPVCSETGIRTDPLSPSSTGPTPNNNASSTGPAPNNNTSSTGPAPNNDALSTVTVNLTLMFLLSGLMSFGQLVI